MYAEQITDKLAGNAVLEINPAVTWLLTSHNLWNNRRVQKCVWLDWQETDWWVSAKLLTFHSDTVKKNKNQF